LGASTKIVKIYYSIVAPLPNGISSTVKILYSIVAPHKHTAKLNYKLLLLFKRAFYIITFHLNSYQRIHMYSKTTDQ
jgi:hypothetical protein